MYEIESGSMSEEFLSCWTAAGNHLSRQVEGGIQSWLRAHPYPPFLEHLSFRLGNQLFFVRIEDVEGKVIGPGSLRGIKLVAKETNGRACTLPMKRNLINQNWAADRPGWGLLDAETGDPLNPIDLVSAMNIEMSTWEVQDMAVQVVRDYIGGQGFQLMSWQANPAVDPSIWFLGKSRNPEWVIVRTAKYPANRAERPGNWNEIAQACARLGTVGHFASVAIVSAAQPFRSRVEAPLPLWRGHGMHVNFSGLE
ncbi:MAG: hypothetical protein HY749_24335 [Gammaproteobacteria bacterium]|nr:hypothetical protein [Gammaproteobacteria bacterium]MBI5617570.1 hypothetical protein [Gammaproteobacteria bacterium]